MEVVFQAMMLLWRWQNSAPVKMMDMHDEDFEDLSFALGTAVAPTSPSSILDCNHYA